MLDHLDDHEPPVPGVDARAALHHRARALTVRHRLVVGGSITMVVSFVLVLAMAIASSGAPRRSGLVYATDPPVTATATTALDPSPSPYSTPSSPSSPTGQPPVVVGPSGSATPGCAEPGPGSSDCPDGKAGWGTGFSGCVLGDPEQAPQSRQVVPGLTAALELPAAVAAGQELHGHLVLRNSTEHSWHVVLGNPPGDQVLAVRGGAIHTGDVATYTSVDIPAGESRSVSASGLTTVCGDTSHDPEPALPTGTRLVGLALYVDQVTMPVTPTASPTSGLDPLPVATATDDPTAGPTSTPVSDGDTLPLAATVRLT